MAKFLIDGRECESYELSNNQLIEILNGDKFTDEERNEAQSCINNRFQHNLCQYAGETEDDVFARFFSNFVNGRMRSAKNTAEKMATDHRYLQSEMFKVCVAYIEKLSEAFDKNLFDDRNKWACKTANSIINHLNETNQVY